ncbi:unnamed protein product [Caenorhabditis sp. 36 PRJEB53466]|nr:unnamed protein product [Caenorhabditis sp. 36 PRJEB53466]
MLPERANPNQVLAETCRLQTRNDIRDLSSDFSDERQEMDQTITEVSKELKLKLLIVDNFIPRDVSERIKDRAEWNDDESTWNVKSFQSTSTSSTPVNASAEVNEDGVLTRSLGADSGVSVSGGNGSSTASSQFLDKRLVATPGCRRPMSMCERLLVDKAREQLAAERRPPISGSGAHVEVLIPDETIRFCGENVVVFSALERFVPDVTDADPAFMSSTISERRPSIENLTIDASKVLVPISTPPAHKSSKNGAARNDTLKMPPNGRNAQNY